MTVSRETSLSLFAIATALLLAAIAPAQARWVAIDGDTIRETETGERVRLENVDSPEIHGRCPSEIEMALRAKAMTGWLLQQGIVIHRWARRDKYGRTIARVEIIGVGDLGEQLIAAGLGRPYHGGRRQGWCE